MLGYSRLLNTQMHWKASGLNQFKQVFPGFYVQCGFHYTINVMTCIRSRGLTLETLVSINHLKFDKLTRSCFIPTVIFRPLQRMHLKSHPSDCENIYIYLYWWAVCVSSVVCKIYYSSHFLHGCLEKLINNLGSWEWWPRSPSLFLKNQTLFSLWWRQTACFLAECLSFQNGENVL